MYLYTFTVVCIHCQYVQLERVAVLLTLLFTTLNRTFCILQFLKYYLPY